MLLSTRLEIVEAISELYQSMLVTQMQFLEKEQPKFKGLVAYHKRASKLSAELEPIARNVIFTDERINKNEFAWLVIRVLGLFFVGLLIMQIFEIISDYEIVDVCNGEEISNLRYLVKNK